MLRLLALAVVLAVVSTQVNAEIYKCVENGVVSYKSSPCGGQSTVVRVRKSPSTEAASAASRSNTLLERYELERNIKSRQEEVRKLLKRQNDELRELKIQKSYAANNLAGATWDQALSTEMTVVTEKYRTRIDVVQKEIERLRQQLAVLDQE